MALLSPGVEAKEMNMQVTIARSSTGRAALAGKFQWGPAYQISQVVSEPDLIDRFGRPDNQTADSVFSGINFLNYGNDLRLVRILDSVNARNSSPLFDTVDFTITSPGVDYRIGDDVKILQNGVTVTTGKVTAVNSTGGVEFVTFKSAEIVAKAKALNDYPDLQNGWQMQFTSGGPGAGQSATGVLNGISQDSNIYIPNDEYARESLLRRDQNSDTYIDMCEKYKIPVVASRYAGDKGDNIQVAFIAYKDYYKFGVDGKPTTVNTVNLDTFPSGLKFGNITPSSYLEYGPQTKDQFAMIVFMGGSAVESRVLSTKPSDRDIYGSSIHIDEFFVNGYSTFVQGVSESWPDEFSGILTFGGGTSGNDSASAGDWITGWDMFSDREHVDVNLFIAGSCAGEGAETASTVQKSVAAICDERQDCLGWISPPREYMINLPVATVVAKVVEWRKGLTNSGAVVDNNMNIGTTYSSAAANYKYQYDKYNDTNRWIPLSADLAGLCARTDTVSQPWMSPAGFNRGQIMNVRKLAIETRQSHRDELYQNSLNAVVGFPGQGFILYGDKTMSLAPTPFDRINVRRLFNLLKKSISESAKYKLFENNDAFTRSSFRSEVNSYLDSIKSLGGIYDFLVICDETNNTPSVIDRNEFVATIMIKPARSINFVTLNFSAVGTGTDFAELVGAPV